MLPVLLRYHPYARVEKPKGRLNWGDGDYSLRSGRKAGYIILNSKVAE